MSHPLVVVVCGPNGAGKSTTAPRLLRGALAVREFVNADSIAQGLSAFRPETVAFAAGRAMLGRLRTLAAARESFAFETTLAGRNFGPWLRGLRSQGFRLYLAFSASLQPIWRWRASPTACVEGGTTCPEDVIRRRFAAGLSNFFTLFEPVANSWQMFDNSEAEGPRLIAERGPDTPANIHDHAAWQRLEAVAL
jgi:predicted ABC-type ATPase